MADAPQTPGNSLSPSDLIARSRISVWVLYSSLITIGVLGTVAIVVALVADAPAQQKFLYVKDILTILLPLLGAWVGTILAFYFSRETFVAAAQQTANLVQQLTPEQRLQSIVVTQVMLDMDSAATLKLVLPASGDASGFRLKTDIIDALLDKQSRNRLPIVAADGAPLYIIHRNYIDQFLLKASEGDAKLLADATLGQLLADQRLRAIFQDFATVSKEARLIAVKQSMDGNPNCSDAFVTENGQRNSRAIGWITNIIVQEKSNA